MAFLPCGFLARLWSVGRFPAESTAGFLALRILAREFPVFFHRRVLCCIATKWTALQVFDASKPENGLLFNTAKYFLCSLVQEKLSLIS
jgi:hypothetical protein